MDLYPWGGEFVRGSEESPVAVVTLSEDWELPRELVGIYGNMKTENLGVEKVVANVISNPRIRFLIVAGREIRGHRSGGSLVALHANGIDEKGRIAGAPGAVPYIENLQEDALERFSSQVEVLDMIGIEEMEPVLERATECIERDPGSFGEPFIAIRIEESRKRRGLDLAGSISIYSEFTISYKGRITSIEREEG